MQAAPCPEIIRFGIFEVDFRSGELRRNGLKVRLPEQSFQILTMLLTRMGQVVTREEIRQKLWSNNTIVEFDHSINAAVRRLREALNDSADDPQFIETLARRGYRFKLAVQKEAASENRDPAASSLAADTGYLPSADSAPDSGDLRGRRISHYHILEELGSGGMGVVYKAEDIKLHRLVALKFLSDDLAKDRQALESFRREAHAASALNHPNIITIHDFDCVDSVPYIAMEFVEGVSLRQILSNGPLSLNEMLRLALQVAEGLSAAHSKKIVHRDLKPENIMVSVEGAVKILDFGVAKPSVTGCASERTTGATTAEPLTTAGAILGTVGYMSPQQANGQPVDFRSDQFSFGAILYEMATGRPAFQKETGVETLTAIIREEPPPVAQLNPEIPPPLEWAVKRCLAKRPEDRYASTQDLARELTIIRDNLFKAPRRLNGGQSTNLPSLRAPLIGRDEEIIAAKQLLLRKEVRLLTLTGAGGSGKTSLALQVAAELRGEFPGGVFFASLATITDPDLVPSAVAQSLNIRQTGTRSARDELLEHVHRIPPTLLLIDNFEQVLEAGSFVSELLISPVLKVLATSRARLRLYGEYEFPVPPLALPDLSQLTTPESLLKCPAVSLFLERARATKPDLLWDENNAGAVAQICLRLDGLPLAIELAAARIKTLSPVAMLARLQKSLQLLTCGPRDAPARQQTLRDAIGWSHELLSAAEQKLFRRLSVFSGGCTLEAAEAVSNTRHDLGIDLLDGVASLVDNSLLRQIPQPDGDVRFRMLETVREYALERLEATSEGPTTRRAHAAYFLVLAEEGATEVKSPEPRDWMERFDTEQDNFRTAMDWLIGTGNVEWSLRLAYALLHFWFEQGFSMEGHRRFEAILGMPEVERRMELRAKALYCAGGLAATHGNLKSGCAGLEQALNLYRELGDWPGTLATLMWLSVAYRDRADYAAARSVLLESLQILEEGGDHVAAARTKSNLADIARLEGDYAAARSLHEECFAAFRKLGDRAGMAWSLNHQGDVAREQGDASSARSLYRQGLEIFRELDNRRGIARSLVDLGSLAREQDDYAAAQTLCAEALRLFKELALRFEIVAVLEEIAASESDGCNWDRALRLGGAALTLRQAGGIQRSASTKLKLERILDVAREHLESGLAARAWMEGSRMSLEQAIEYAQARDTR